jgi:conjugal transfer pilus assembly protein TraK
MKFHFLINALLCLSSAFAATGATAQQSGGGLLYPSAPVAAASVPATVVSRPGAASVVSAMIAGAAASSPSPAASAPAKALALPAAKKPDISVPPGPATSVVTIPAAAAATSPSASPASAAVSRPAAVKKSPGPKVYTATVSPQAMAEEARLLAESQIPAGAPGAGSPRPASPTVAPVTPSALAAFLGDGQPLPKWVLDGEKKSNGQSRILVSQGVTEIIKIARNFPNRFITPFASAEVITTDDNLTHDGVGGSVVVATSGDKPIGIFLQDRDTDRSIGIVLIPEDIPQRELRLVLDDSWATPIMRAGADASPAMASGQSDYVESVKAIFRQMAKGDIPDGHALAPITPELVPNCQIPGLSIRPGQMLEGTITRIVVYVASNQTSSTLPVQESGCFRSGVLAVSAYPRPVLDPGQSTEVYVLMRKDLEQRVTSHRRPVLVSP